MFPVETISAKMLDYYVGRRDTLIIVLREKEFYMHSYKGKLEVDGRNHFENLYLQVYKETKEPWCDKKQMLVIAGIFLLWTAIVLVIIPKKRCNENVERGER